MNRGSAVPARLVRRRAALRFLLQAAAPHDFPQYPPNYREYVYVTNGGSDTVTVLDVVNVRVDRELPVGRDPVAVAASPTRNEIYVVNSGAADAHGLGLGDRRRAQHRGRHHSRAPPAGVHRC